MPKDQPEYRMVIVGAAQPHGAQLWPGETAGSANWRADAACRDADPDLFFPISTAGPGLRQVQEAKRICRACPVQTQCLAWALDHGVTDGVWGGTTEDQRRAIGSPPGTAAEPAAPFGATSIPWACLHDLSGRPGPGH